MRVFRKLLPYEIWRLREHLLRLSSADRRARFFAGVNDDYVDNHCRRLDALRAIVIGFFEDGVLRGAAELHLAGDFDGRAELAITVEGDWQGHHIGTELLGHAITVAENRGMRTIEMVCLIDNRRMEHVARNFTDRLDIVDDQAEAHLKVPYPTQLSLWQEVAMDGMGLMTSWLERFSFATLPQPEEVRAAA
ncbi:MAG TPA: GNAT family N-acetyltransferase [Stellaceae bacterium]|nr:GNAT family N-acetyltransferase [Stellaceae bacterium]